MKIRNKQILSVVFSFAMVSSFVLPTLATGTTNAFEEISWSDSFYDAQGNEVEIFMGTPSAHEADTYVSVYVNGDLNQETYVYSAEDKIVTFSYLSSNANTHSTGNTEQVLCEEFIISDLVHSVEQENIITEKAEVENLNVYDLSVPFPVFNSEDWALIDHLPSTSNQPFSLDLYSLNYDEEPYNNPMMETELNFSTHTPISTIVGAIRDFIEFAAEKIDIKDILINFGVDIILSNGEEVIAQDLEGTTAYSTQKILYAPVIDGYNIYPSAYITKLFLVGYNVYTVTPMAKLIDNNYDYYPQPSTMDLMIAARNYFTDWARGSGYLK